MNIDKKQILEDIENYNKQPKYFAEIACCYLALNDFSNAALYFEKALLISNSATLHYNLASAYFKNKQFVKALESLQQTIKLEPNFKRAYVLLATIYYLEKNYKQAIRNFALALNLDPGDVESHFKLGLVFIKQSNISAAKIQMTNVINLYSEHRDANFYLAIFALQEDDLTTAEDYFNKVLIIAPDDVDAITNLGVIALKQSQGQLAIDNFTKALAIDNDHLKARNNIAAVFMDNDLFENALMHYDVLLKQDPNNLEYLYNAAVAQMSLGHLAEAANYLQLLLTLNPKHNAALSNMAAIYIRQDKKQEAIYLLEKALASNEFDYASSHMLAALKNSTPKAIASKKYAEQLFDNYALYYDKHVLQSLQYKLPHLIGNLVASLPKLASILDLGCGTGLCAPFLRNVCTHLTGVDISKKMLTQASKKNLYDKLICAEVISYLEDQKEAFDLIVAADLIPYIGALEKLFAQLGAKCKQHLLINFEVSPDKPWQLQDSARYSHKISYIARLAKSSNFQLMLTKKEPIRLQKNKFLESVIMLFCKN